VLKNIPEGGGESGGRPTKNPAKNGRVSPTLSQAGIGHHELWVARERLAKQERSAVGTFVPMDKTWSDYCQDIGSSAQDRGDKQGVGDHKRKRR